MVPKGKEFSRDVYEIEALIGNQFPCPGNDLPRRDLGAGDPEDPVGMDVAAPTD